MQTPEEFAWTLYAEEMDFHDHCWYDKDATVRFIAARDEAIRADERAKVLAGFEVERADRMVARRVPCDCPGDWQHHGRFAGDDGLETHVRLGAVPSRRLVGPWEPMS